MRTVGICPHCFAVAVRLPVRMDMDQDIVECSDCGWMGFKSQCLGTAMQDDDANALPPGLVEAELAKVIEIFRAAARQHRSTT